MAIARVKTWVSEILTASDLNAEFNNILTYLNSGAVTLTQLGIGMTPVNVLDITQSQNAQSKISLLNASDDTSAAAVLDLAGSGSTGSVIQWGGSFTTSGVSQQDGMLLQSTGAGGLTLNTAVAQPIYFGINSVEKARLESTNGALLIGTTTIPSATNKLTVETSAAAAVPMRIQMSHATPAASFGLAISFTGAAPDDNTAVFIQCGDTSTARFIVYSDGDVVNHDNSYGAISKREIKQDIIKLPSHWSAVKAYPLRQYRMIEDVEKHGEAAPVRRGVVADELEKVAPHLVKNGEYVVYSHMYLEAVAALQEAMARIEVLEAKVKP